jgi:hypothetical protein
MFNKIKFEKTFIQGSVEKLSRFYVVFDKDNKMIAAGGIIRPLRE